LISQLQYMNPQPSLPERYLKSVSILCENGNKIRKPVLPGMAIIGSDRTLAENQINQHSNRKTEYFSYICSQFNNNVLNEVIPCYFDHQR